MLPKAVASPIEKSRAGTMSINNLKIKIMEKLIKLFQLVLTGSALILTLTLSVVHFQTTLLNFCVSVLMNTLIGALVWLSLKELINED